MSEAFFAWLGHCLALSEPADKCAAVAALHAEVSEAALLPDDMRTVHQPVAPGRPARPRLVDPARLPRRRLASAAGHAALLHAVVHIEFNAINLALDAAHRFRGLPRQYYLDWLKVAAEEAGHFAMLREHLQGLGHAYGDFDAHGGLWAMALDTAHDAMVRMALVPRVLEARGLDVTPQMMQRLHAIGDTEGAALLAIILRDEVGHVAIGSHWFELLCARRGRPPAETFARLVGHYLHGAPRGPFNEPARRQAGFSCAELAWLRSGTRS